MRDWLWTRRRVFAHAATVAGLLYIALVWVRAVPYAEPVYDYGPMFDARGYWLAWQGGLYDIPWLEYEAYVYPPAFAQAIWPLTLLPWPAFAAIWTGAAIGCLFWMRVPWMLAFPGVVDDILRGNVHTFIAAAIVLGFRFGGAWALPILTKVTPVIGLGWYALRFEWRGLAWAAGITGSITLISFLAAPDLWREWFALLTASSVETPRIQVIALSLPIRLLIGLGLVGVAARRDWPWLLPLAVLEALPNVWPSSLALLAGVASLAIYPPPGIARPIPADAGERRESAAG